MTKARRLFILASIFQVAMCVAAASLWVRSYWRGDTLDRRILGMNADEGPHASWFFMHQWNIESACGELHFGMRSVEQDGYSEWYTPRFEVRDYRDPVPFDLYRARRIAGFHWSSGHVDHGDWNATRRYLTVIIPDWAVFAMMCLLSTASFYGWSHQRKQYSIGLCCKCGYDLRATPNRCPECGTIPKPTGKK